SNSVSEDKIHASWVTANDEKGRLSVDIVVEWLGTGNNCYFFSGRTETNAGHLDRTPKGALGHISNIEAKSQNVAKDLQDGKFDISLDLLSEHPVDVKRKYLTQNTGNYRIRWSRESLKKVQVLLFSEKSIHSNRVSARAIASINSS
ncbi:hypothetical protein CU098_003511, partial [Rhizopus stolonifer]